MIMIRKPLTIVHSSLDLMREAGDKKMIAEE